MPEISVEDAMTKDVVYTTPDEKIIELAKKMREKDIGSMVICDKNKLVGLITSEDLIKRIIIPNKDPTKMKASDVMTKKLITTTPDESLSDAIVTMLDNNIKRLPVVDEGKLVGILTDGDILRMAPNLIDSWIRGGNQENEPEVIGDVCEICGNYSDNLTKVNGLWVCEECRDSTPKI